MPIDHLAAFVCPGFVVKFNNQNNTAVESHVPYHFLEGKTSIKLTMEEADASYYRNIGQKFWPL